MSTPKSKKIQVFFGRDYSRLIYTNKKPDFSAFLAFLTSSLLEAFSVLFRAGQGEKEPKNSFQAEKNI